MSQLVNQARYIWDDSLVKGCAFRGFGITNKPLVKEIYEMFGFGRFSVKEIYSLPEYSPKRFHSLLRDGVVLREKNVKISPYYYTLSRRDMGKVNRENKHSPSSAEVLIGGIRRYLNKIQKFVITTMVT